MSDHLPLTTTKIATSILKCQTKAFPSKNYTFRIWKSLWSAIQILDTPI